MRQRRSTRRRMTSTARASEGSGLRSRPRSGRGAREPRCPTRTAQGSACTPPCAAVAPRQPRAAWPLGSHHRRTCTGGRPTTARGKQQVIAHRHQPSRSTSQLAYDVKAAAIVGRVEVRHEGLALVARGARGAGPVLDVNQGRVARDDPRRPPNPLPDAARHADMTASATSPASAVAASRHVRSRGRSSTDPGSRRRRRRGRVLATMWLPWTEAGSGGPPVRRGDMR